MFEQRKASTLPEATDVAEDAKFVANQTHLGSVKTVRVPWSAVWARVTSAISSAISGLSKSSVGLPNVDNTSDLAKPVSTATQTALNGKAAASHTHTLANVTGLEAALLAKASLVGGKVPSSELPSIALTAFLGPASNQSAMLLLSADPGDFCFRTDQGLAYFCIAGDGSQIAHWQAVSTPGSVGVVSVNGHVGVVVLSKSDVGLSAVDNTSDALKPISTATQAALNGKAAASHTHTVTDLPVATQSEAEAGTLTTKLMTPQRVAQAVTAQAPRLLRGTGVLFGHTVAGSAAQPARMDQGTSGSGLFIPGDTLRIEQPGALFDMVFEFVDGTAPSNPSAAPVDISGVTSDLSTQFDRLIAAISVAGFTGTVQYSDGENFFRVETADTGSSESLTVTYAFSAGGDRPFSSAFASTVQGADAAEGSGAITEVVIVPANGRTVKPVNVMLSGSGVNTRVDIAFKSGSSYFSVANMVVSLQSTGSVNVGNFYDAWISGRTNMDLVARMVLDPTPTGGNLRVTAILETI